MHNLNSDSNLIKDFRYNGVLIVILRHRQWIPHMPFLFSKAILKELHAIFAKEINLTSSHRKSSKIL